MTSERWQQIEELFHEAIELDAAERPRFLAKAAANDDELRREVEQLLSQHDAANDFIEQPVYENHLNGVVASVLDEFEDPMIGSTLGAYTIDREVGRGGMGAVYLASRSDGEFRQRVAIKIVKRGVDTDHVIKRFRNERQILASLDHPFITRLIDGGTTPDGRPYFVMDMIEGLSLYDHADKYDLSVEDRLRLFCRICEAVEYAHQKHIIHRDLKPTNIIIARDGSPRLLDFGIAKLLDPDLASDTLQPTATALRMMTVDYASPEQIRGEIVTYATDIYSLGVILFELLTGRRPYQTSDRSDHEIARAICDEPPPLPSAVLSGERPLMPFVPVSSHATTLNGPTGANHEQHIRLADNVRGNIDNLILKALRKEPSERFADVASFRRDIERHLDGEMISYRDSFASKNRIDISSTKGKKLVAVLPLTAMNLLAGGRDTEETYLSIGLTDAIITRLASVRQLVVRPTSSVVRYGDPETTNPFRAGRELGVDYVLDGRIRRFGDRIRISLQLLDLDRGSAIWAKHFDEKFTDVLQLEDAISKQVAVALIPQLTGADKRKLAKRGTDDPKAYEAYLKGRFYWNQFTAGSLPKSFEAFQKAVDADPNYALAYAGIADFYMWANIYGILPTTTCYEMAESAALRALSIDDQLGEAFASLGLVVSVKYSLTLAEQLLRRAIDLNPNYPLGYEWLSANMFAAGRPDEGIEAILKAQELDPVSLRTKTLVAFTFYQNRQYAEAIETAKALIADDGNYPQGYLQLGLNLAVTGSGAEAVAAVEKALDLMPDTAMSLFYYCSALTSAGRREDALGVLEKMKATAATSYIKPIFLAYACAVVGQRDEAFSYLSAAVDECDPWLTWLGTDTNFDSLRQDGRFDELFERAHKPSTITDESLKRLLRSTPKHTAGSSSPATAEVVIVPPSRWFSFLKRHYLKLSVAALVLILIAVGVKTGVITASIGDSQAPGVLNPQLNIRSMAVLPFDNLTGDTEVDYLCDGLFDNLIERLPNLTQLRVPSRQSVVRYRGSTANPTAIGREIGVDAVLSSKMTYQNGAYVLETRLIRVGDGNVLFQNRLVERPDEMIKLQEEMATNIAAAISTKSIASESRTSYTANNDAFRSYLQGEYQRQKATPDGIQKSIELYKQALALDQKYALAYQGLALAYRSAPAYGVLLPDEAYTRSKEAALNALALDPTLSTPYVSLASIKATYDWDFEEAERQYRKAIERSPNSAEAHFSFGNFLVSMGRVDEGLVEFHYAEQLDPFSLNIPTNIAWAHYIAGRFDEAESLIRQVLQRDTTFARAYLNLGEILQEKGQNDAALASIQKARQLSNDPLADMAYGHALATAGRRKEALSIANALEEKARRKEVSPFLPAVVFAGLDDKDKAFYWLERAYQERSNWLTLIKVGRRLKNLTDDPRFEDLLGRIGFPK